jgi:hypothetical protein
MVRCYSTVLYGMFSTPLRGCGRGRENGLVAIQAGAKRRNARPRPLRLASPPLVPGSSKMKESCAAGHAFSESSKCIHPKYFLNLRIQTGRAQNGPSRCGPGQCSTLSRPRWTRCRTTSPSQEGTCRPEATLPDRSAALEVGQVARQPALHCTTFTFWTESRIRNPSCHDDFQQPRPSPLPFSPPPLTGRREARRPAAQDAGDPTTGETSRAVPQPIEATENARFSIVQQRIQRDQPAKA